MFPTLIDWPIPISTFGLMVALGFIVAGQIVARTFADEGHSRDEAWRLILWCAVGGIAGAKLWYVGEQMARGVPGEFTSFLFSRGGLTWYGGFVGGLLGGLAAVRSHGIGALFAANACAPALAVGQAVGRIGCLLVGDDYGRVTDLPWGIAFPQGLPPTELPVHPTMVYEAVWLFAAGWLLWRRRATSPSAFAEYLVLAGLGRLWVEAFRVNPAVLGPLSNAQLTAAACIALGLVGWLALRARGGAAAPARGGP